MLPINRELFTFNGRSESTLSHHVAVRVLIAKHRRVADELPFGQALTVSLDLGYGCLKFCQFGTSKISMLKTCPGLSRSASSRDLVWSFKRAAVCPALGTPATARSASSSRFQRSPSQPLAE